MFENDPSRWFRSQYKVETEIKGTPKIEDIEKFWSGLWGKEEGEEPQWKQWEEEFRDSVNIESHPINQCHVSIRTVRRAVKKMKPWKAPGWDKIYPFYWQRLTSLHEVLTKVIEECLKKGSCPEWMTLGRTVLLGKEGKDTTKVENYRPITCLLIIYKVQSSIIAQKIKEHIHANKIWPLEQLGTLSGTQGCKELILVDMTIADEVRTYRRNLCEVWTDIKKAYDTISQKWILKVLEILEFPEWLIDWIKSAMSSWRTRLEVKSKNYQITSKLIDIICGIFQGDSLSPILFCLGYLFVSLKVRKMRTGYIPGNPGCRDPNKERSHIIFMDDFKGFAPNKVAMKKCIETSVEILSSIGLEIGVDKCAVLEVKRGNVIAGDGIELSNEKVIDGMDENSSYKYLGIIELLDPLHEKIKKNMTEKFIDSAEKVWGSKLTGKNKVMAYNMFCTSKLTYTFGTIKWRQNELKDLDVAVRKILSKNGCHNIHGNCERLYMDRVDGGKGMLKIQDIHNRSLVSLVAYIFNANSEHAKLVRDHWIGKKEGSTLKVAEDIIEDLDLGIKFTDEGTVFENKTCKSKKVGKIIKDAQREKYSLWLEKPLHGKILKTVKENGHDKKLSFRWLQNSKLKAETESTVFDIQEQSIPTKVIKRKIWKYNLTNTTCRMCGKAEETVAHIMSGCSVLAPVQYTERHNNIARVIYYFLNHKFQFTETVIPYYDTNYVKGTKENENVILYWDYPMATNNYTPFNKPDIVVIFKNISVIWIIEISCPWDENICEKIKEKRRKYIPLAIELKDIFQKRESCIFEIVLGTTGIVQKSLLENLKKITVDTKEAYNLFDMCQKAAILGSTRLVRQVFQLKDD